MKSLCFALPDALLIDGRSSLFLPGTDSVRVLCYNVLAEKYAVPELLHYCPTRYLKYEHRKQQILKEMLSHSCDFIALQVNRAPSLDRIALVRGLTLFVSLVVGRVVIPTQEVEAGHYKTFFEPQMSKMGYGGTFRPKSRARTMMDGSSVDGCVLFHKSDKYGPVRASPRPCVAFIHRLTMCTLYGLVQVQNAGGVLDRVPKQFDQALRERVSGQRRRSRQAHDQGPDRRRHGLPLHSAIGAQEYAFISFAAIITVLGYNNSFFCSTCAAGKPDPKEKERIVVVVNTHIHWDPEYPDVKLMQVCMLMEELEAITSNNKRYAGAPFLICGDFNSMPDSGVYKYIRVRVPPITLPCLSATARAHRSSFAVVLRSFVACQLYR